ncbi:MAG: ComF family protein [Muribaculaceae bacterium]|nr:ComF family protein [Muribaculaceae bacterium]
MRPNTAHRKNDRTMSLLHWLHDLLNFALPARCHICDASLAPHERFVCTHCLNALPRTGFHRRRLNPMEERFAGHFPFIKATGFLFYNRESPLSSLMQDLKYRKFPDIGTMLGQLAATELFPTGFFNDIELIVPMPMHFHKEARRGYNQTHYIAEGISRATSIPVSYPLKAIRGHRTQTSLSREERLRNTSGIFAVKDPALLNDKDILLVDDVCTTGATISEAGSAIIAAAPSCRIHILTIGVTF